MSKVRLLSVLFAAIFAVTAFVGCGDSGGTKPPPVDDGGDNGGAGGTLVLGANRAWTDEIEYPGAADGYIFNANNTYKAIRNYCGVWEVNWEGTYTVSGNRLNVTNVMGMDMSSNVPFSITDNMLILNGDEYMVTNNITVVTEGGCDNDEELLSKSKNKQKLNSLISK